MGTPNRFNADALEAVYAQFAGAGEHGDWADRELSGRTSDVSSDVSSGVSSEVRSVVDRDPFYPNLGAAEINEDLVPVAGDEERDFE